LSLRDPYARRPQQPLTPAIAAPDLLGHSSGLVVIAVRRADGFVQLRIESFADGVEWSDTMRFEQTRQLPVDRAYTI
jgi:hypothetical protein